MSAIPMGVDLTTMNTAFQTPITELCPPRASLEPPPDVPEIVQEP